MDNNQVSDNLLGYTPAPDAIQEFNLITNNAPAEFGNFMGGIVSATIKSGTNSFHGDIWEFFRNDALNANSWSNNFNTTDWPDLGPASEGQVALEYVWRHHRRPDHQEQAVLLRGLSGPALRYSRLVRAHSTSLQPPSAVATSARLLRRGSNCQPFSCTTRACPFTQPCTPSSPAAVDSPALPEQPDSAGHDEPGGTGICSPLRSIRRPLAPDCSKMRSTSNSNQFNVDQGDLKVDYKPNDKDTISGRFTRSFQNNPSNHSLCVVRQRLCRLPNLQHRWRLDPHDQHQPCERCPLRLEPRHCQQRHWLGFQRRSIRQYPWHRQWQPCRSRRTAGPQVRQFLR